MVKTLPPKFDAAGLTIEQLEAASRDGTKIPYFVVHRTDDQARRQHADDPDGLRRLPALGDAVLLGDQTGKLWLERGGAFVLANIRGGGEFGPAWHEAGLKTQRQRIYDDFAAVGEDLIAKRLHEPVRASASAAVPTAAC